jgi:putative SOS response-associated peptidase YedK
MCNRYRTARDIERLRTLFHNAPEEWVTKADQKYDTVYPRSIVPVYLKVRGEETFKNFEWGIMPGWAKSKSASVQNTRSEEVFNKPIWMDSFRRRRCLMPAENFFEPATFDGKKYQVRFELKNGLPFCFAGIWEKTTLFGEPRNTCSLLTCEPNALVGEVHGRMPLILHPEQYSTYLDTPEEQAEQLVDLFIPFPADEMIATFDATST